MWKSNNEEKDDKKLGIILIDNNAVVNRLWKDKETKVIQTSRSAATFIYNSELVCYPYSIPNQIQICKGNYPL